MKKNKKKVLWITGVLAVVVVLLIVANNYVEHKIKAGIEEKLKSKSATYKEVSVSLLGGDASISEPNIELGNVQLRAEGFQVKNINYLKYLFQKKIAIGSLEITNPEILVQEKTDSLKKAPSEKSPSQFKKDIEIATISLKNASVKLTRRDSIQLYLHLKTLQFENVVVNQKTIGEKVPFNYESLNFDSDSLYYNMNGLQILSLQNIALKEGSLKIENLKMDSPYNKVDFQKQLSVEKDRYQLQIASIHFKDFKWGFKNDSLQLGSSFAKVNNANFQIYRNKVLPDDPSVKPLYSQMLRNSNAKLDFDSISIENSRIIYEEKEVVKRKAGKISFYEVRAGLKNVRNTNLNQKDFPKTKISAHAKFMNQSPVSLNLEFKVNDTTDNFHISGNMGHLSAEAMNAFLTPAINIKVQGKIESLAYNFYGNPQSASGDMQLKYNDFKVEVLKKDGSKKNGFLSTLANLVVNNKAHNKEIENKGIIAQPDKTKSFWNYLWLCIRNGALKSFI